MAVAFLLIGAFVKLAFSTVLLHRTRAWWLPAAGLAAASAGLAAFTAATTAGLSGLGLAAIGFVVARELRVRALLRRRPVAR